MAFNVSLNLNKSNQIAGLALANVESLAVGGSSEGWDKVEKKSKVYEDGVLKKEIETVDCYEVGPTPLCTESRRYKYLKDDGTWSDWIPY